MGDFADKLQNKRNLQKKGMPKNINVDASKCKTIKCKCGYNIFVKGVVLKEVKGILFGNGAKNSISQVEVLYCGKCGTFAEGYEGLFIASIQEPETNEVKEEKIITLDTAEKQ